MRVDTLQRQLNRDASVIREALQNVWPARMPKRFETQALNIRGFIHRLNTITEPLGVFNEIQDDKTQAAGTIVTSGLWLYRKERPENGSHADVRILWHLNPKTRRFQMTPYHWNRRRFFFYQTLLHELIHRYQGESTERVYRTRSDDRETKEQQIYLGNTSEIETHAHDAALELWTWWPTLRFRAAMQAAAEFRGQTASTVNTYLGAFSECPSHPALAHFKRKTRAWYDLMMKHTHFYQSFELVSIV